MTILKYTCPCCGSPGERDFDHFYFDCKTLYKAEPNLEGGYSPYGPLKGRTPDCYEREIEYLEGQIRKLTEEKIKKSKLPG